MAHSLLAPAVTVSAIPAGAAASVRVPASSANLGPGFDSVGIALDVWDVASARVEGDGLVISHAGLGSDGVPLDENHLVYRSMLTAWDALNLPAPQGLRLDYTGSIPHSRGMGSSASAVVAGVALAAALAGLDLDDMSVLAFISDVASGIEGHPDNASASVFGNATVSWADAEGTWRTCVLPAHESLRPTVIVPDIRLDTAVARAALPTSVSLGVAAANGARTGLLTVALTQRPDLLFEATQDFLHQEPRRSAYPASMELVDRLRAKGIPAAISGAGPTVLAFGSSESRAEIAEIATGLHVLELAVPRHGVHAVSH